MKVAFSFFFFLIRQTPDSTQFYNNIRDIEDGMFSDEEVKNTSYIRSCSTNSSENPFPPLVEVPRQDHLTWLTLSWFGVL